MKVEIIENVNSNFKDTNVRWDVSSSTIWLGKEKNWKEVDKLIDYSYGCFQFNWNTADYILFNKEDLILTTAVVIIHDPIFIKHDKIKSIENKNGTLKILEKDNFDFESSDSTTYYVDDDSLVGLKKENLLQVGVVSLNLTNDFSFLIANNDIVGWILRNASTHIVTNELDYINFDEHQSELAKEVLPQYLDLTSKADLQMSVEENKELKENLQKLLKYLGESTSRSVVALKDEIEDLL